MAPAANVRHPRFRVAARVLVFGLAAVGAWFAIDGARHGTAVHRVTAVGVGVLLMLPALFGLFLGRVGRTWARGLILSGVGLLAVMLPLEALFRAFDLGVRGPQKMVSDPILGLRGVPWTGDLDGRGYRNEDAPEHVDVVVLGDSNTHGFKVLRSQAFPQQLASASGWSVYSMAQPGYGALQYLALAREAVEGTGPKPRVLVVGLYFGNDLVDAHRYLGLDAWAEFRDPALPVPPIEDWAPRVRRGPNAVMRGADWLRDHSVVVGWAAHVVTSRLRENSVLAATASQEVGAPRYGGDAVATLFTPRYRAPLVNPERPQVRDGLRVTARCLEQIAATCRREGVVPVLLLLHTKEFVYHEWLSSRARAAGDGSEVVEALATLAQRETQVCAQLLGVARAAGIAVLDPTPKLVAELARGRAMYWATADGHLAPGGCAALAAFLHETLAPMLE